MRRQNVPSLVKHYRHTHTHTRQNQQNVAQSIKSKPGVGRFLLIPCLILSDDSLVDFSSTNKDLKLSFKYFESIRESKRESKRKRERERERERGSIHVRLCTNVYKVQCDQIWRKGQRLNTLAILNGFI